MPHSPKIPYTKPAVYIPDLVQQLVDRGLACDDRNRAKFYLGNISYYRLSAYFIPFEQSFAPGAPRDHIFKPGTSFDDVLQLYVFDRKLRLLVSEAIERIEIAVRSQWANQLAIKHGPHAYMNSDLVKSPHDHLTQLARVSQRLTGSNEIFVLHYLKKYSEPFLPPIWAMVETLSIGTLSRWFANTNDDRVKQDIARALGLPTIETFEGVLEVMALIRNIAAHHGRLWNRHLLKRIPYIKRLRSQIMAETIQGKDGTPQTQATNRMYNPLVVMILMMRQINPASSWPERLRDLLNSLPLHHQPAMGLPADWQSRAPWTAPGGAA